MPEGNFARWLATYLLQTILRLAVVRDREAAYANLPIYYVEGKPEKHVSPDVFFVRGVPHDPQLQSYKLFETGVCPRVVFEIVSPKNPWKDRVKNRRIYQTLGVEEYYWFEPKKAGLTALRLDRASGKYAEVESRDGRFASPNLGLEVGLEGRILGLYESGVYILPTEELLAERERELAEREQELAEERRRRQELELRLRELEG